MTQVTDGWDYQNQYLPMAQDHPKPDSERHTTLCGVEHTQVFETSQNAAQVSYLLPTPGRFAVSVRFVRNSTRKDNFFLILCLQATRLSILEKFAKVYFLNVSSPPPPSRNLDIWLCS